MTATSVSGDRFIASAPYFDLLPEIPLGVRRTATTEVRVNFGSKIQKPANDWKLIQYLDGA
jgi:hypothetical protein